MPRALTWTPATILGPILFAASSPLAAYPIPAKPLWSLTEDAHLVVWAKVASVEPYDSGRAKDFRTAAAQLEVLETWKGPAYSVVEVPFDADVICPAPARYVPGEKVVAFLEWDGIRAEWSTVSRSYGTLYPADEEVEDMQTVVRAALSLQSKNLQPEEAERARLDWLVQAAALPGTRWHGLYELEPRGDPIRSFYDRDRKPFQARMSREHRGILIEAFLAHPKADFTSVMLLRLLRKNRDERLVRQVLGMIEAGLALDEPPMWLQELMREIFFREGERKPNRRFEEVHAHYWELNAEQLRAIWSKAKADLRIDDVPPVDLDLPAYKPVGGRTPS